MTPAELEALETDLRERAKPHTPKGHLPRVDGTQRLAGDLANIVAHLRATEEDAELDAATLAIIYDREPSPTAVRHAAVSMIERPDGKLLCVWNRRYNGWSLPGGMVEEGETVLAAQSRELAEETGLTTLNAVPVFEGEHGLKAETAARAGRASVVHVFRVEAKGLAREMEDGCPITWLSREEFVTQSPFGVFYVKVFAAIVEIGDPAGWWRGVYALQDAAERIRGDNLSGAGAACTCIEGNDMTLTTTAVVNCAVHGTGRATNGCQGCDGACGWGAPHASTQADDAGVVEEYDPALTNLVSVREDPIGWWRVDVGELKLNSFADPSMAVDYADKIREPIAKLLTDAVAEEREACAMICGTLADFAANLVVTNEVTHAKRTGGVHALQDAVERIRARSTQKSDAVDARSTSSAYKRLTGLVLTTHDVGTDDERFDVHADGVLFLTTRSRAAAYEMRDRLSKLLTAARTEAYAKAAEECRAYAAEQRELANARQATNYTTEDRNAWSAEDCALRIEALAAGKR